MKCKKLPRVLLAVLKSTVPEIIDLVLAKTSPKRWFSMTEYERFGLVFTKTRVYKFGHSTTVVSSRNVRYTKLAH
jgi:hypothetical protein